MPYTATCPPPDLDVSIYGRWTHDTVMGIWESYNKINFVNAHVLNMSCHHCNGCNANVRDNALQAENFFGHIFFWESYN